MQQRNNGFHSVVASLWFRLASIAIVALVFPEALFPAQRGVQGWVFYLSTPEVAFDLWWHLITVALACIVLGTIVTAAFAPLVRHFDSSRERLADGVTNAAVVLAFCQSKPEWMPGLSLAGRRNRNGEGEGEGLAFTEYFERNRVFAPLQYGTVGVIDGRYQYVLDLPTQKGLLRPLNEAQIPDLDRSAEKPGLAQALRAAICSRFPDLPRKTT